MTAYKQGRYERNVDKKFASNGDEHDSLHRSICYSYGSIAWLKKQNPNTPPQKKKKKSQ